MAVTHSGRQGWLKDVLAIRNLTLDAPLDRIADEMNSVAKEAAPIARFGWKWLILVEGMAVVAPLLWLIREPGPGSNPFWLALTVLVTVLLLVGSLWWMRWRHMQRTWARARMVAEVARSQVSASILPKPLEHRSLESVPTLHPLLHLTDGRKRQAWPKWRTTWGKERLQDQLNYYRGQRQLAELANKRFTFGTTVFMDLMLALATAGVLVSVSDRGWSHSVLFGERGLMILFGVGGVLLPLGVILIQLLRHLQELKRRSAKYSRQIGMLKKAKEELKSAQEEKDALRIAADTERELLSEVVDWYYEAETAEQFFRVRKHKKVKERKGEMPPNLKWHRRCVYALWGMVGVGFLYLIRVVLGRVPLVVIASAITLTWLSRAVVTSPQERSKLGDLAQLVDGEGHAWQPDKEKAGVGCIIIVHGLRDGVGEVRPGTRSEWMAKMKAAMEKSYHEEGKSMPNIGLLNWKGAATPGLLHRLAAKTEEGQFLTDLAGIQPEAYEVGDMLAFRLVQMIREKKIDATKPLHFIGHSAGGFVVTRAANWLKRLNLAPATMHVTILDTPTHTPVQDEELLSELPKTCGVDFYRTSGFVLLHAGNAPNDLHFRMISYEGEKSLTEQHSYAYQWFTETIGKVTEAEGFSRSPLAPHKLQSP